MPDTPISQSTTDAPRLDTGERITVRPWWSGGYEAVVLVPSLPGPADRHSIADTPEAAVRRLRDYVAYLHAEDRYAD